MPEVPPRRIFVVGCPRSGTTLLQSMLAAHPDVHAFRETHALRELENTNPVLRRLGVRRGEAAVVWRALGDRGVPVEGRPPIRVGTFVRRVVGALDRATLAADRRAWSEKTPGHLRSLPLIARFVPTARVVHVVRSGVPAVSSLFAVTHDHGEAWGGERSVDLCVTRWRNDLHRTAAWAADPRHLVVGYESLVREPDRVLTALVRALELPTSPEVAVRAMLSGYAGRAAALQDEGESWKAGVAEPLSDRNAVRVDALTASERVTVEQAVAACAPTYEALPFL